MKSIKNKIELKSIKNACKHTDSIMFKIKKWCKNKFKLNKKLSEKIIYNFTIKLLNKSKNTSLSFQPCCAAGKNTSIIHHTTYSNKSIKNGSLFLLDIGKFHKRGYATDLTRTFFLSKNNKKPTNKQKNLYTLVLKSSISGLNAKILKGTTSSKLDKIIRYPIKQAGFDYLHSSGHGIGINVHETPPIISKNNYDTLIEGQVFSIEPGIYIQGFCGIRLENLVTLIEDPINKNYLKVLPLTFTPFEDNLIEPKLLTSKEKKISTKFLKKFLY
jgi:Xaa-Pro aminopeptidase